ncbi:MAG: hypothetical protein LBS53_04900, partial [Synergistaceae bacterium]|nr:hypothetical protein [Synergistaceae bacterium]
DADFDLDSNPGVIIDPPYGSSDNSGGGGGGSGGGCSTGLGFGLLPLVIGGFALLKRKHG